MKRYRITYRNTSIEAPDGDFVIGRGNDCHLVLDDPSVSRVHAIIRKKDGELTILDQGSRNGVILNKKRLNREQQLQEGDQIVIGHQVIRIATITENTQAERTQGIIRCQNCGAWSSGDATTCSSCGNAISGVQNDPSTQELKAKTAVSGRPSFSTLCELASKSIQVGKVDEAERLMDTIYASAKSRISEREPIASGDFEKIANVLLDLAKTAKNAVYVSRIFELHHAMKRLMSRELVEQLYDVVRPAGYLACKEMTRYLTFLDSQSQRFSPGELFVHRRLNGLVKLCS